MKIEEELKKDEFYYMDDEEFVKGMFKKPKWYTEEISKAYSDVDAEMI